MLYGVLTHDVVYLKSSLTIKKEFTICDFPKAYNLPNVWQYSAQEQTWRLNIMSSLLQYICIQNVENWEEIVIKIEWQVLCDINIIGNTDYDIVSVNQRQWHKCFTQIKSACWLL